MLSVEFFAMGCQMQALCQLPNHSQTEPFAKTLAGLSARFAQAEQRFSRFLPDSELSQLNQQRQQIVSENFWQMLQHALASAKLTNGMITPTLLQALQQKGYTQDFHKICQKNLTLANTNSAIQPLPNAQAWQALQRDSNSFQITLPNEMGLDFGGFAKGLTAWQCAKDVAKNCHVPVLIDAGGDIITHGVNNTQSTMQNEWQDWVVSLPSVADMTVPIEHLLPTQTAWQGLANWHCVAKESSPLELSLPCQNSYTVATSGIDYRFWWQGDRLQHHLINPHGSPHSDIVCASVLIDDSHNFTHPAILQFLQTSNRTNLAQTLSKLCCLLGVNPSLDWLNQYGLEQVAVSWIVCGSGATPDYEQWLNPTMQKFCLMNL